MNIRLYDSKCITIYSDPMFEVDLVVDPSTNKLTCRSVKFGTFDATYKINPVDLMKFVDDLCSYYYKRDLCDVRESCRINLHEHYFPAESIRDIYSGALDNLIKDSTSSCNNKAVSFGFLAGDSKPQRKRYIEACVHAEQFEYISTQKYDRRDTTSENFYSIQQMKSKYKYFVDLRGHSYSTKSLLFVASKRVFFYSEPPEKLMWEREFLQPWQNYVPIKNDLSDLQDNYNKIESDERMQEHMISNNINLLHDMLSKQKMDVRLHQEIDKHLVFK